VYGLWNGNQVIQLPSAPNEAVRSAMNYTVFASVFIKDVTYSNVFGIYIGTD